MPIFADKTNLTSLTLSDPQPIQGGTYFSKISMTGVKTDEAIYIQTPKCETKDGVVKTEKRLYSDIIFSSSNDEHTEFIELLRAIEGRLKECIYSRREMWFQSSMDGDDIDYYFNSPIKQHKKNDFSVRTFIVQPKKTIQAGVASTAGGLIVYDDEQCDKTMDDIAGGKPVIGLLQLRGIKFTNSSLHLELVLSQVMILKQPEEPMQRFLIQRESAIAVTTAVPTVTPTATPTATSILSNQVVSTQPAINPEPVVLSNSVEQPQRQPAPRPTNEITEIDDFSEEEVDASPVTLKNPKTVYTELYVALLKRATRALRLYQQEIMEAEKFRRLHSIPKIDIADILEEEEQSGEFDVYEESDSINSENPQEYESVETSKNNRLNKMVNFRE
jgi:hypothetical protein